MTACGTSYHAGLVGEYLFEELARMPVEVEYASEFRYRNPPIDRNTVVLGDHAVRRDGRHAGGAARVEADGPHDARHLQRRRQQHRPRGRRRRLPARRPGDRRRQHQGVHVARCTVLAMLALYFGRTRHLSSLQGAADHRRAAGAARTRSARRSTATTAVQADRREVRRRRQRASTSAGSTSTRRRSKGR